jgi:hypothetical protein
LHQFSPATFQRQAPPPRKKLEQSFNEAR